MVDEEHSRRGFLKTTGVDAALCASLSRASSAPFDANAPPGANRTIKETPFFIFCTGKHIAAGMGILLAMLMLTGWLPAGRGMHSSGPTGGKATYNVLFIAVDDLRPQLGSYGKAFMHTPNIDRLASQGVRFTRHYVQYPSCGPSRWALLTGQRPDMSFLDVFSSNTKPFRVFMPQALDGEHPVSLAHLFRRHGYYTVSIGKIGHSPDGGWHEKTTHAGATDDPEAPAQVPFSWDEVYGPRGEWGTAWRAFFAYADGKSRIRGETPPVESADIPDTGYPDGLISKAAVEELHELERREQPFFLAVGFYKPHLPFNAPQEYWDLYEHDALPLSPVPSKPAGVPAPNLSWHRSGELVDGYGGLPSSGGEIDEAAARTLRHGYFAAVSYVDAQIGKVLDALRRLGLREETIVVLWGDHGWHLGDLDIWGKHTPYEFALRSPLIIRVPGLESAGAKARGLAEAVDIYPTLAELCGLPAPEDLLDGESLVPLLRDPTRPGQASALSYYGEGGQWATSLRTDRYRLIRWADRKNQTLQVELYDHQNDPYETHNIAREEPGLVRTLLDEMKTETNVLELP